MEASDKAIESLRKLNLESSYLGKTLARTIVKIGLEELLGMMCSGNLTEGETAVFSIKRSFSCLDNY